MLLHGCSAEERHRWGWPSTAHSATQRSCRPAAHPTHVHRSWHMHAICSRVAGSAVVALALGLGPHMGRRSAAASARRRRMVRPRRALSSARVLGSSAAGSTSGTVGSGASRGSAAQHKGLTNRKPALRSYIGSSPVTAPAAAGSAPPGQLGTANDGAPRGSAGVRRVFGNPANLLAICASVAPVRATSEF